MILKHFFFNEAWQQDTSGNYHATFVANEKSFTVSILTNAGNALVCSSIAKEPWFAATEYSAEYFRVAMVTMTINSFMLDTPEKIMRAFKGAVLGSA